MKGSESCVKEYERSDPFSAPLSVCVCAKCVCKVCVQCVCAMCVCNGHPWLGSHRGGPRVQASCPHDSFGGLRKGGDARGGSGACLTWERVQWARGDQVPAWME